MMEKTTIGGTTYDSIGSSSSNLLLKCNGTARIQWGNKLIDLIKNGKIASGGANEQIFIISDESQIKSDGIYILNTGESSQLLVYKNKQKYNLTESNLYISATNKQNITVDQKQQALENIGIYYNTLEEVENAKIQNGIVYVIDSKTLYTIKDGLIEEFEAKLQTITVEEQIDQGNKINNSVEIVLSIKDKDYIILSNDIIRINNSVYVKDDVQICSENYSSDKGYCLSIVNGESHLDVDTINIRKGNSSFFTRGMIIMYSGINDIPEGWAICDGSEHVYNGVTVVTPNLTNRFIKAVSNINEIGFVNNEQLNENNELYLSKEHLPQHTHSHKHTFSKDVSADVSQNQYSLKKNQAVSEVDGDGVSEVTYKNYGDDLQTNTNSAQVQINVSGDTSNEIENEQVWENNPIKIEPNYYSLIFIMKL